MNELGLPGAIISYCPNAITKEDCDDYYDVFIKTFDLIRRKVTYEETSGILNRATCVFGDIDESFDIPDIWGEGTKIYEWTTELLEIKKVVEGLTGFTYNICLCNYYSTKKRTIGWHSDREEFGDTQSIASISIGSERMFEFRKKGEKSMYKEILLENGSLLWMGPGTQENYEHCVPSSKNSVSGRINLTFRKFNLENYKKKYLVNKNIENK